jgi:hypothetical protein
VRRCDKNVSLGEKGGYILEYIALFRISRTVAKKTQCAFHVKAKALQNKDNFSLDFISFKPKYRGEDALGVGVFL